jgi:hypothetical protein
LVRQNIRVSATVLPEAKAARRRRRRMAVARPVTAAVLERVIMGTVVRFLAAPDRHASRQQLFRLLIALDGRVSGAGATGYWIVIGWERP